MFGEAWLALVHGSKAYMATKTNVNMVLTYTISAVASENACEINAKKRPGVIWGGRKRCQR